MGDLLSSRCHQFEQPGDGRRQPESAFCVPPDVRHEEARARREMTFGSADRAPSVLMMRVTTERGRGPPASWAPHTDVAQKLEPLHLFGLSDSRLFERGTPPAMSSPAGAALYATLSSVRGGCAHLSPYGGWRVKRFVG